MRTLVTTLFLAAFALLLPTTSIQASVSVTADGATLTVSTKTEKKGLSAWIEKKAEKAIAKKVAKLQKRFAKDGAKVDFQDPVNKWMWFWLFGWGIGLILQTLFWGGVFSGGLWALSGLFWLAGTVCLIIWLLKKTGNM
jgi:hypothetical protein